MTTGIARLPRGIPALALLFVLVVAQGWAAAVCDASVRVLILPFRVSADAQASELQAFANYVDNMVRSSMGRLGEDLSVETEKATEELLKKHSAPAGDEEAHQLASDAGVDMVLYGFIAADGGQYRMKSVLWDLRSQRVMVAVDQKVSNIHGLSGVLQVFVGGVVRRFRGGSRLDFYPAPSPGPAGDRTGARLPVAVESPRKGPWMSGDIEGALLALDVGELVGDKKNETVFLEESTISISRIEAGGLRQLAQISESPAKYISLEVERVNGDGPAKLLLCYQTPAGIESAIATYRNRDFQVAQRLPDVVLRTILDPDEPGKRILVGQRTDVDDIFSGEMIRFREEQGKVVPSGTVALPPGTFLPSYASGRLGKDGDPVRIILNQDQRLMVFDNENRLLAAVTDRIYGLNRRIRIRTRKGPKEIASPGRILIADSDGDGENELLVIKQTDGSSYLQALTWDRTTLVKKWETVRSEGIISDFQIRDFMNHGSSSLALILVRPVPFFSLTGPRSVVFTYDLAP